MQQMIDRRLLLGGIVAGASATSAAAQTPDAPAPRPAKRTPVKNAVVLVTGSNRGVGRGFVEALLARGAKRVYATARNPKNLAEVVALDPKRVVPLELDVTNDTHRRAAADKAQDVTWLINNAANPGSFTPGERRFYSASNLDDIKAVMDTNCWSPAELARLFIPIILKNGGGAVLNILSGGALFCLPEFTSYSTSKAAAMMMTAGLRAETDRMPILIASVFTGGVQTRSLPIGATTAATPLAHANEVIDAVAEGKSTIFPATGPVNMRDRICQDPEGFERRVVERFHTNPVQIAPYD
ncbi:MAG: SDR family NAD(P)-dependent oxidoreductase [Rhodospirillaceae bacterium]|nr:SDR family NAD(P)-dependent oxidoreductase [Rhodospirillaceae bacterium]